MAMSKKCVICGGIDDATHECPIIYDDEKTARIRQLKGRCDRYSDMLGMLESWMKRTCINDGTVWERLTKEYPYIKSTTLRN
jgi:hypothetical protein